MSYNLEHRTTRKITTGTDKKLGSTIEKDGVNFALFSQYAQEVFLLLFDTPNGEPTDIIKIESRSENIWHVCVHGIKDGQLYGYKIRGEYNPAAAPGR